MTSTAIPSTRSALRDKWPDIKEAAERCGYIASRPSPLFIELTTCRVRRDKGQFMQFLSRILNRAPVYEYDSAKCWWVRLPEYDHATVESGEDISFCWSRPVHWHDSAFMLHVVDGDNIHINIVEG